MSTSKQCPRCGANNPINNTFCSNCRENLLNSQATLISVPVSNQTPNNPLPAMPYNQPPNPNTPYNPPPSSNMPPPAPPYNQPPNAPYNQFYNQPVADPTQVVRMTPPTPPRKSSKLPLIIGGGLLGLIALIALAMLLVVSPAIQNGNATATAVASRATATVVAQTQATNATATANANATVTANANATATAAADATATAASNASATATALANSNATATANSNATAAANATATVASSNNAKATQTAAARPATTTASTPRPATTTVAATGPITAPSGYQVYTNNDQNKLYVAIAYPKGWQVDEIDDKLVADFGDSNGNYLTVVRSVDAVSDIPPEAYNARIRESRIKDGWTLRTTGSRRFGFAGETWVQSALQKQDGADLKVLWIMVALHKGTAHAVYLEGNDKTFNDLLADQFSEMLNSMRFLDGPVYSFANETAESRNPDGLYIINYPVNDWQLDDKQRVSRKDGKNDDLFYVRDAIVSSKSVTQNLEDFKLDLQTNVYKDQNFKETKRFDPVNLGGGVQEQFLQFTYTGSNGSTLFGELAIRKQGQYVYAGVYRSSSASELGTMYRLLWQYLIFQKS